MFQRLTDEFGGVVLKDLALLKYFMSMQAVLSGSSAYGLKWAELQLNYHKAPSKNTTEVQSRWNNSKTATDPFRFLGRQAEAAEFLKRFRQVSAMTLAKDAVDFGKYDPPEEPPETHYRCRIEDTRRQNDNMKEWWKTQQVVEQMEELSIGEGPNVHRKKQRRGRV